jgi:hypothetical protein
MGIMMKAVLVRKTQKKVRPKYLLIFYNSRILFEKLEKHWFEFKYYAYLVLCL